MFKPPSRKNPANESPQDVGEEVDNLGPLEPGFTYHLANHLFSIAASLDMPRGGQSRELVASKLTYNSLYHSLASSHLQARIGKLALAQRQALCSFTSALMLNMLQI